MVRLTIKKPEREPESMTFTEPAELTVGRSSSCSYCLDFDPMVSRMHAVILIEPPIARIKDLNSTNGITINGEAYGASAMQGNVQPVELQDGDQVGIGSTVFQFSFSEAEVSATAVARSRSAHKKPISVGSFVVNRDGEHEGLDETVSNYGGPLPTVPGYSIKRFLSRGQTGDVYLAVPVDGGKPVVIKLIASDLIFSRKMLDDFRREVEEAARVQHAGISRILGSGELDDKTVFLIVEYVNGEDLASYLLRCTNNRLPTQNAYNLMLQLSEAICHLHRVGYVHMDLKPSSIMLYDDNGRLRAKVTDMGYAHFMNDTGIAPRGGMDTNQSRLGYIAPEEAGHVGDAKTTADVFSLSAIFYEMLTGRVPYNFAAGGDDLLTVSNADMTPIEEAAPGLPEPLVVIIERGLSADPDARYQTGCDLLEAMENVWI